MDRNNVGDLLLEKGTKYYRFGKSGFASLFSGILLAAGICLVSMALYGRIYFFDGFAFTAVLWICAVFLVGMSMVQIPLYLFGMHLMGLGRLNQYNAAICRLLIKNGRNQSHEFSEL